jgi:hypothetical protein
MSNKKLHIGYARLNEKSLNNFLKGKSFMIKPSDQDNEDNTVVKLQYKAKKNLTKLNKNLSMQKGVRVNPDELEDMEIHSGDGLFDSLKGVMSSKLTKGVIKAVAPQVANIVGNQVQSLTGSNLAGNMTKSLITEGSREMTGNGIFDSMKGVMSSKLTKGVIKAVAPQVANIVGNQVQSLTGSNLAGNMTKSLITEGSREMTSGSGFKNKRGGSALPLGGSLNPNQFLGISHTSPDFSNVNQRMAYVRSHRRGVVM